MTRLVTIVLVLVMGCTVARLNAVDYDYDYDYDFWFPLSGKIDDEIWNKIYKDSLFSLPIFLEEKRHENLRPSPCHLQPMHCKFGPYLSKNCETKCYKGPGDMCSYEEMSEDEPGYDTRCAAGYFCDASWKCLSRNMDDTQELKTYSRLNPGPGRVKRKPFRRFSL